MMELSKSSRSISWTRGTQSQKMQWWVWLWLGGLGACVKVLLIPSYHSTDLEVHRNWLAVTNSLPLSRWYFDETSPWTLDYPPFFAYFEYFLSMFAALLDPSTILQLHPQKSPNPFDSVIYFQRITVILSDLCLLYAVHRLSSSSSSRNLRPSQTILMWVLVVWSPALAIVDHIHFQYNGFLLGILLLSISYLQQGTNDVMAAFLFAVLLCFKHLFAVAAPLYFVYLLRHYCWKGKGRASPWLFLLRLSLLGALIVAVFAAAFAPFLHRGRAQIQQIVSRMFPFGRGICHAYWAPNFWVFYIILDKFLAFLLRRVGFNVEAPAASFTGGLVGNSSPFAVLPQVTPLTTAIMVLLALSPCLIKAWKDPRPELVARWIAYAYTCGFLFGWHVHEKASLHFVIPLAIVAVHSLEDAKHYFLISIVSCYSLFPLLYEAQEYPIKVLLLVLHSIMMWYSFSESFTEDETTTLAASEKGGEEHLGGNRSGCSSVVEGGFLIGWIGKCYLFGLIVIETWGQCLHPYLLGDKLPFIPLMVVSIYCALEMMHSWIWQLKCILRST